MAADASQRRLETLLGHLRGHHHDPSVSFSPTSQTEGSSERELYMLLIIVFTASNFRYTLNNTFLTSSQRQFYEDNGFLIIRRLIPQEQLEIYHERFRKICCGDVNV